MSSTDTETSFKVAVIGAGPAGLMAAEALSRAHFDVHVFDAMPSAGRKLLMAGKSGLNVTHAEGYSAFLSRYGGAEDFLKPMLDVFGPDALRQWLAGLGIETFTGSSLRVFPTAMKAAPFLRAWLHRLRGGGVKFHMRHRWAGWDDAGPPLDESISGNRGALKSLPQHLRFETPNGCRSVYADAVVLALGGASWPRLGSTGAWVGELARRGVAIEAFKPSNCGFRVNWSEHFRSRFAGEPVKSCSLTVRAADGSALSRRGEFVITRSGVEGSLIYALSAQLRENLEAAGKAVLALDLAPDRSAAQLAVRLAAPRGKNSFANHLRKCARLDGVKAALLREIVPNIAEQDAHTQAESIKALPIALTGSGTLEEAISTAGGIGLGELDGGLMLRRLPGVFCAGEMLAWDAPTGGYLLTACFATGLRAGAAAAEWLARPG